MSQVGCETLSGSGKIKTIRELELVLEGARQAGKRIVLCHGVFDLLHPGHILHFKQARRQGDLLVVTVTPDCFVRKGPGRPAFHQSLRLETIAALEDVSYTALNEWPTAVETIQRLKPHVYVKGSDYADPTHDVTGRIVDEEAAIRSVGGSILFTDGEAFSSSHLINRFLSAYPEETQTYLQGLRSRTSADRVIDYLKCLSDLRVLVVGEAILDQYCYCIPMGKSPKETIVSTKFLSEEQFAGGALAVANHLAGFCKEVMLVTPLGDNEGQADFIRSKLRPNVQMEGIITRDRPTVIKRRYVESNYLTKMFEVQYLNDVPLSSDVEEQVEKVLAKRWDQHDFVAVADFGHGLMTQRLREFVSSSGRFLALNTQSNSANLGFNPVTKYTKADFVCIDEPELKLAAQTKYGDLVSLATEVKRRLNTGCFLVSRGSNGLMIFSDGTGWVETPALAVKVVDRTGAGDALFSVASACVFKGFPADVVGFIGNCVGALAVEIVCNRQPVEPVLLYKFITSLLK